MDQPAAWDYLLGKVTVQKADPKNLKAVQDVLNIDKVRVDMTPYESKMLEDPNRGSWDLWPAEQGASKNGISVPLTQSIYGRDPRQDVYENGVIGIDFGTKSTVVTYMGDTTEIRPLRVGMADYGRAPRKEDYENPTVMELKDLGHFLKDYRERAGRPHTRWEDLVISHTAANDWKDNDDSDRYFSFIGELKQWAGTAGQRIRLRDGKGKELTLPPYLELTDKDLDPIELYAYYLGLFINNQHGDHKIYMNYLLSFPVNYTKEVQQHILESFRKGLAKSLPSTVLADETCMEKFRVERGVSEPAAYAVCALQELNLAPSAGESILYGVFDFGGGTTDFDFGTWRRAQGPRERRYRYVIEHYSAGGDQYLGGENLLELLAYEVFKANADTLRAYGEADKDSGQVIPFVRPPQCSPFAGDEAIVNDSQEARSNTHQMAEALRPFWEGGKNDDGTAFKLGDDTGEISLALFTSEGERKDGVKLKVDKEKLEKILTDRIEKGVVQFFDALIGLKKNHPELKDNGSPIHILLAGNSSQSPILQAAFHKEMKQFEDLVRKERLEKGLDEESGYPSFILHQPIGLEEKEAAEKAPEDKESKEKELENKGNGALSVERPTGKTGVAFGLIQCRKGSKIKVVSHTTGKDEEAQFHFWVGLSDGDEKFAYVLHPESAYGAWADYIDAGGDVFEFFYTTNTGAEQEGRVSVNSSDVKRMSQRISAAAVNEDHTIYIRAAAPGAIEYAVAESQEKADHGQYTYGPVRVTLED